MEERTCTNTGRMLVCQSLWSSPQDTPALLDSVVWKSCLVWLRKDLMVDIPNLLLQHQHCHHPCKAGVPWTCRAESGGSLVLDSWKPTIGGAVGSAPGNLAFSPGWLTTHAQLKSSGHPDPAVVWSTLVGRMAGKDRLPLWPSNPTPRYSAKRNEYCCSLHKLYANVLGALYVSLR